MICRQQRSTIPAFTGRGYANVENRDIICKHIIILKIWKWNYSNGSGTYICSFLQNACVCACVCWCECVRVNQSVNPFLKQFCFCLSTWAKKIYAMSQSEGKGDYLTAWVNFKLSIHYLCKNLYKRVTSAGGNQDGCGTELFVTFSMKRITKAKNPKNNQKNK